MVCDFFKTGGDNEAILDITDLSEVQLENDNVQAFDTKWDDVLSAYTERPTDSMLVSLYKMQVQKSDELKYLLQVYAQETTLGDDDDCRLKLMMAQTHLVQKIKEANFKARNRDEDRLATGVPRKGIAKRKKQTTCQT